MDTPEPDEPGSAPGSVSDRSLLRRLQRGQPDASMELYLRYAERLLRGLDGLDWPEHAKRIQREWIGRSEGAEVRFRVAGRDLELVTFTTRPDTLFGVTFLAVPPEHPELEALVQGGGREEEVRRFVQEAAGRRIIAPVDEARAPRGVFTGVHAVHPATDALVPIWVAEHVVATYGTGAVMGVPAHDRRDAAFADSYGLPVVRVVEPPSEGDDVFGGEGTVVDSGPFTGMSSEHARGAVARWLSERGAGGAVVSYRF